MRKMRNYVARFWERFKKDKRGEEKVREGKN